jgi:exopolyphosphatase/pppGpp-phosphohydrolase
MPLAVLQEGEDTMLVGGGGAARTIGCLLQKLAEAKGEEAAKEAWQATGEQLAAFLPQADREDEAAVKKVAEQFGVLSIAC